MAEAETITIKAVAMTEENLLSKVIKALGLTTEYHSEVIRPFFDEVKFYLSDAGIRADVILSSASVGLFIRGVSDLWNYGAGNANLSPYFKERVIQLATTQIEVIEEEALQNG